MSDKLPRLNYLTMMDTMLMYRSIHDETQEFTCFNRLDDIWEDTLSQSDKDWFKEVEANWSKDSRKECKRLIRLVYAEDELLNEQAL